MLFNMKDCLNWLMDQDDVYDFIIGRLVSINEYQTTMKGVYFDDSDGFDGLSIVFAFRIPGYVFMDNYSDAYAYINDTVIKLLKLDIDKIRPAAIRNLRLQISVRKMDDIFAYCLPSLESVPLGVLTTNYMNYGAFYLCDLETLNKVCDSFCKLSMRKVMFIPSSAHELIFITDPEITTEMAKSLIYECNREPDIVDYALTDHIYIYDRDTDSLTEI
jgi:hypothetical protein